ncbi:MAG: DUF411 domain-containing protein [Gammaproteobacteria bacterium]|nr:DUF411 domain-containing protein [Gammaproteobacteria bacterium]MCW9029982.1 DUF411 domain-containing protein [Gammaproteobacteria bacterium]
MKNKVRHFIAAIAVFSISLSMSYVFLSNTATAEEITVYKSPTCGCCNKWVKHLEGQGFDVKTQNIQNINQIKNEHGVQQQFQSCHTAIIGKYFIEGHVPANDIKKLLKEQPDIKGLAVPGMPMGSPGMEGHRKDRYDVVAIDKNNKVSVYSNY